MMLCCHSAQISGDHLGRILVKEVLVAPSSTPVLVDRATFTPAAYFLATVVKVSSQNLVYRHVVMGMQ